MRSQTVKSLSYLAFWAGAASVAVSGGMYLYNVISGRGGNSGKNNSLFIGLWAPSLFTISEMLDRIAEEDQEYMGVRISDRLPVADQARELIGR